MLEEHFRHLGPIEKWCATKRRQPHAWEDAENPVESAGMPRVATGGMPKDRRPPNFIVASSGTPGVNFGKKCVLTLAHGLKNNSEACRQLKAAPPPVRDEGPSCGKMRDIPRTRRECRRERVPTICLNGDTDVTASGSGAYWGLLSFYSKSQKIGSRKFRTRTIIGQGFEELVLCSNTHRENSPSGRCFVPAAVERFLPQVAGSPHHALLSTQAGLPPGTATSAAAAGASTSTTSSAPSSSSSFPGHVIIALGVLAACFIILIVWLVYLGWKASRGQENQYLHWDDPIVVGNPNAIELTELGIPPPPPLPPPPRRRPRTSIDTLRSRRVHRAAPNPAVSDANIANTILICTVHHLSVAGQRLTDGDLSKRVRRVKVVPPRLGLHHPFPPFILAVCCRPPAVSSNLLPFSASTSVPAKNLPVHHRAWRGGLFVSVLVTSSSPRKRGGDDVAAPGTDGEPDIAARNQNQFKTLAPNAITNKRSLSATDPTPEEVPNKKRRARYPTTDLFVALPSSTLDTGNQRVLANVNIGKQTREELKETCTLYGIPQATANKSRGAMVELLQAYSAKGDWSNLEAQARNSHKGPKEGSAPTAITRRRDAAIADGRIKLPPPPVRTALPADEYLKPKQSLKERQFILDYVDKFVRENPILSPEERRPPQPMSDGQWKTQVASMVSDTSVKVSNTNERVNDMCNILSLLVGLPVVPTATATVISNVAQAGVVSLPVVPTASTSTSATIVSNVAQCTQEIRQVQPTEDHPHPQPLMNPHGAEEQPLLVVATVPTALSRQVLALTNNTLPAPPNDGFLGYDSRTAVKKLMSHWDPAWKDWAPDNDWFCHQGIFVPMSTYPTLYRHTPLWSDHSGDLRKRYSRCLILATEYIELGGEGPFWAKYSKSDGNACTLKDIFASLKHDKTHEAQRIRDLYTTEEFSQAFSYNNGGKTTVLLAPSSIIKRHKKILASA
ncbi:hypothetical protein B0H11DRAFT_1898264 [Mycena galericulata]|nr:hypothetical protein B0H11DRAFT_1898264 [Mycena galericulata]